MIKFVVMRKKYYRNYFMDYPKESLEMAARVIDATALISVDRRLSSYVTSFRMRHREIVDLRRIANVFGGKIYHQVKDDGQEFYWLNYNGSIAVAILQAVHPYLEKAKDHVTKVLEMRDHLEKRHRGIDEHHYREELADEIKAIGARRVIGNGT